MKKTLILKCFILFLICISCKQKSNKELKDIDPVKIQEARTFKNDTNNSDDKEVKEVYDIKEKNSTTEKYICYTNNTNTSQKIWIGFNNQAKATQIKYKGQTESIPLKFVKNEYLEGGTQPTIIDYYDEIYNGKINGRYILTKSGNWYYLTYKRGKDDKQFNFTIDHTANNLSSTPCF